MSSAESADPNRGRDDITYILYDIIGNTLGAQPFDTQPMHTNPEQVGDPLEDSLQQADNAWAELHAHLTDGGQLRYPEAVTAGVLLYTLVCTAAERADATRLEQYLATLAKLTTRNDIKIAAYVCAGEADNQTAKALLRDNLRSEWSNAATNSTDTGGRLDGSPMLHAAVQATHLNGNSADTLIDSYAVTTSHALHLRLLQLQQTENQTDRHAYEERVASDFIALPSHTAVHLARRVTTALQDPILRLRVIDHYLHILSGAVHPQAPAEHRQVLEDSFAELLWHRELREDEALQRLAQTIHDNRKGTQAIFVDQWEIDQLIFAGNTPKQITQFIDKRAAASLSGSTFELESEITLANRDTILTTYAQRYAAHGDFAGAKLCLSGIGNTGMFEAALQACTLHSDDAEQLNMLRPSNMRVDINEADIPSFAIAMAGHQGDTEGLCSIAMSLATQPGPSPAEPRGDKVPASIPAPTAQLSTFLTSSKRDYYIYSAYSVLVYQDELRAHRLAAEILDRLRAADDPRNDGIVQFLSDALIRGGSTSELAKAHDALKDESGKLPLSGALRLLNLGSQRPLPKWLQDSLGIACD